MTTMLFYILSILKVSLKRNTIESKLIIKLHVDMHSSRLNHRMISLWHNSELTAMKSTVFFFVFVFFYLGRSHLHLFHAAHFNNIETTF